MGFLGGKMPPLVSIIIPCYNQGRYLASAVKSALAQTYKNIEVVVVDDGSTDDTAQVMGWFADESRVKFLRQKNLGPSAARNAGVIACGGVFLNFLDADDSIAPEKLERQLPVLEADSRIGFVYCDIAYMDENGADIEEKRNLTIADVRRVLSGDVFDQLFTGGYFPPHSPLVRRSAFEEVGGFDPALRGCCDWDLWLRLSGRGFTAQYLNEKLASYRLHLAGMSRDVQHMRDDEQRVIGKILTILPHRTTKAYSTLRMQLDEVWEANTWLNAHRAVLEEENTRLKTHIVVLGNCPKFIRYPIYGALLMVKHTCSALRKIASS